MRCCNLKSRLILTLTVLPLWVMAQNVSDCSGAIVVCGDRSIDVPDSPGELNDFQNPDNSIGCHETGESSSVWLYFRFRNDMPPGSELLFTISPYEGGDVDYDFALFAADTRCDSLGEPDRCSYAWSVEETQTFQCGFCPFTGLGNGETDLSEGIFFDETGAMANGYVAPMIVEPGQGFYLYINEFYGVGGEQSESDGFNISFSGQAADYFDCTANPNCELQVVALDQDTALCSGNVPFTLNSEVTYATGFETYTWMGSPEALSYLDDPSSPAPQAVFPDNFSGTVEYILEVSSDGCTNSDTMTLSIEPSPTIMVGFEAFFCEGTDLTLDAGPDFASYEWSTFETDPAIVVDEPGVYTVTVTAPGNGCTIIREVDVTEIPTPAPIIDGGPYLCEGTTDTLVVQGNYDTYSWVGLSADSFLVIDQPGNYLLRVTDPFGCQGDTTLTIEEVPAQQPQIASPPGLCPDGDATLALNESWSAYQWSDGSIDSLLVVDSTGNYAVTVTDTFGCSYFADTELLAIDAPLPEVDGDTVFCDGGSSLLLTVQNYEGYLWSTGDTTNTITVEEGGTYLVTVTAANGCTGIDSLQVNEYDPLALDVAIVNAESLCAGDTVFAFVDQMYPSYIWSNGATGPAAAIAEAGSYSVTVTDDRGCTAVDSIQVDAFLPPEPEIFGPAGLCPDASGVLSVAPFVSVDWGGTNQDFTLPISAPGTYSVTVVDENGCIGADTLDIAAFAEPEPQIGGDTSLCEGGAVSLFVEGLYASLSWDGGSTDSILVVNAPGTYGVTVTSQEGCTGSTDAVVAEFSNPQLTLDEEAAFCANSSVEISANGTYTTYNWSNGATTATTVVDSAGIYQLEVTNEFGCTATDDILVQEEAVPVSGLAGPYAFCENEDTEIQANTGYADYQWSVPGNGPSVTVDAAGTYYVTITGANNCVTIDSAVAETLPLPVPEILGGPSLCIGSSLELSANAIYATYSWEGAVNAPTLDVSMPGTYGLTVTDANGCTGTTDTEITEVPLPEANLPDSAAFCTNGSVDLEAAPGFAQYSWSTGDTSAVVEATTPGLYYLTVTDANSCQDSFAVTVAENPLPDINLQGPTTFCEGDSITLSVAPAEYPFVTWSTGSEEAEATISAPGVYQVSVLDLNGCIRDSVFTVEALPLPMLEIVGPDFICANDSATLQATPGLTDYSWSSGATTSEIVVDSTASYLVTAAGANGCSNTANFEFEVIDLPDVPLPDSARYCEDGSVVIGVPEINGLAYEWATGETASEIEVDAPGSYILTATTPEGCTTQSAVAVEEIPEPEAVITGDLSVCPGEANALSVADNDYTFLWSTGDTTSQISVSDPQAYMVTVTDAFGCVSSANAIVVASVAPDVEITGVIPFCERDSIFLNAGDHTSYQWSGGETTSSIPVTQSGDFAVTVTNAAGCTAADTIQVSAYPLPDPELPAYQAGCDGEGFLIEAQPGFESYLWSNGEEDLSINVQTAGLYTLLVTDENGCTAIDTAEVFIQPTPELEVTPAQNICLGSSTTIAVEGEWAAVQWSNGATTNEITVSEQGGYGVVVTDSLGCTANAVTAVFVFVVDAPEIEGDTGFCPSGAAVFAAEEGYASYQWSNGMTSREISVSEAGVYAVTVQDTVGCMNAAEWEIKPYAEPEVDISGQSVLCEGTSNELSVTTDGTFLDWSTGETTMTIEVSVEGFYTARAQSDNECIAIDTFEVDLTTLPLADAGEDEAMDCDTRSVFIGPETAPPGSLSFMWTGPGINSGNQNNPNPEVSEIGVYGLVVTDLQTGCVSELSAVEVTDNSYTPTVAVSVEDTLDCNTPTVTLTGTGSQNGPTTVYQWLDANGEPIPGATNLEYGAGAIGDFSLMVTDTETGCFAVEAVSVQGDYEIPTVVINPNAPDLDCNTTSSLIQASVHAVYGAPMLQWSEAVLGDIPGADLPNYTTVEPGHFFLTVTDPVNGCSATDSIQIAIDTLPPVAIIVAPDAIDCINETVILDASESSLGDQLTYSWSGPESGLASGVLQQTVATPGNYQLIVQNGGNGCADTAQVWVSENPNTLAGAEVSTVDPICFEDENGQIRVLSVTGGTGPYLYSLNGSPLSMQPQYTGLGSGNYELVIQDVEGCEYETTVLLEEGSLPQLQLGEDQEIRLGDEVFLNALTNLRDGEWTSIEWAPQDSAACDQCLSWIDQPERTIQYFATITDTAGCTATDNLLVRVIRDYQVYIPNAFTPNGDGSNDFFLIFAGSDVVEVENFEIYSRWGERVFQMQEFPPNDPRYGWNGVFRGQPMNIGHFTYFAQIRFVDGEVRLFKGGVNLVR
jgi:gliding motility-associated-like protein